MPIKDFDAIVQMHAIRIYLKSFGYKAVSDSSTFSLNVQDPVGDTFVIVRISNWKDAKNFVKVRANI